MQKSVGLNGPMHVFEGKSAKVRLFGPAFAPLQNKKPTRVGFFYSYNQSLYFGITVYRYRRSVGGVRRIQFFILIQW